MEEFDNIIGILKEKLGVDSLESDFQYGMPILTVKKEEVFMVLQYLKYDKQLGLNVLTTMCGIHYPDQQGRELAVMYQLHNLFNNARLRIKTYLPIENPTVQTVTTLWPAANWMEREAYDFYGILFERHPDLRRILNVDEMDYFPLRKEYQLEDATREDKDDKYFGR